MHPLLLKAFDLAMVVRTNPYDRLHLDMLQSIVGVSHCKSLEQVVENISDAFLKKSCGKPLC